MSVSEKFQKLYDEAMAKLVPKPDDRQQAQALGSAISQAIVEGLAAREAENAEANDPDKQWRKTLTRSYPSCPAGRDIQREAEAKARLIDAAHAWGTGARWQSDLMYPSMDTQAYKKHLEERNNE